MMMLGVERREGSSNSSAGDEALPIKKQLARYFLEAYDGAIDLLIQTWSCIEFINMYFAL